MTATNTITSKRLNQHKTLSQELIYNYLGESWSFGFDRAVRRAGLCNYQKKLITVSRHFAAHASQEDVQQIVLHEIAHALAGPKAGHGQLWKQIAKQIGYVGGRTTNIKMLVEAPWRGTCSNGHEHERFKRPNRKLSCGLCSSRFSTDHLIEWEYLNVRTR